MTTKQLRKTIELRESNEAGYRELRDFVIEHMVRSGTDIEQLAREKISESGNPNMSISKGELNRRRISAALSGSFGLIVLDLRQQAFVLCTRNNPNISRRNVQGSFSGADFYTDEALSAGNPCRLAKDNNDVWVKIRPIKTGAGSTSLCLDDAVEEIVCNASERMLLNTKYAELMEKEKPNLFGAIRKWLSGLRDRILKIFEGEGYSRENAYKEAKILWDVMDEMQEVWDRAMVQAQISRLNGRQQRESGTESGTGADVKSSIREIIDEDGYDYGQGVYLDTPIFNGVKPRYWGKVLGDFIYNQMADKELVMYDEQGNEETVRLARTNDRVKKDGAKSSHKVLDKLARQTGDNTRNLAIVHMSELLKVSQNQSTSEEHSHQWLDENGWILRTAVIQDKEDNVYAATLNIADGKRGKILYEINNVRPITGGNVSSTGIKNAGPDLLTSHNRSDVGTVPQTGADVKSKFKASDRQEQDAEKLQRKYPNLDLNEDISELDGVPAIELTDGSVIPIPVNPQRGNRYTHVEFIEKNRIDVDDLKSGGWIGNGVYDSSFQSDTQRYIDRQKARKRVAELTGNEYQQFKGSSREMRDTAEEAKGREESAAALRRENRILRERIEHWKKQSRVTKEYTLRNTDTLEYARELVKRLDSAATSAEVNQGLQEMGAYLLNAENVDWDMLWEHALTLAHSMTDDVDIVISDEMKAEREDFESFLKSVPVDVAPLVKAGEISYSDLKGYPIVHRKNGTTVDDLYQQLQERFGEEIFPDVPNGGDMIDNIKRYADAEVLTKKIHKVIIDEAIFYLDVPLPDKISILPGSAPSGKSAAISAEGVFS